MKHKRIFFRLAPAFLVGGGAVLCWGAAHEIRASRDIKGNSLPATYAASGTVTITCVRAVQSVPLKAGDMRPACHVAGPGIEQQLSINASVQSKGGGTVTLTCTGVGELGCTARIGD